MIPFALGDDRFADSLETFRKDLDGRVAGGTMTCRPNSVGRRVLATTNTTIENKDAAARSAKNVALGNRVADVYREINGVSSTHATFGAAFVFEPTPDIQRTEYGTIAIVLCSEPGLQVLKEGVWCSPSPEESRNGVVIAGALHPSLPSTRFRFSRLVRFCLLLTVEPCYVNEFTRAYYHKINTERGDI